MIFDTDILIWYLRGNQQATSLIKKNIPFSVSCITLMELMQGAKNKADQKTIYNDLKVWNTEIIHINENMSVFATQLMRDFSISKGLSITDALVAATVKDRSEELLTGNVKHYSFIPDIKINVFRP